MQKGVQTMLDIELQLIRGNVGNYMGPDFQGCTISQLPKIKRASVEANAVDKLFATKFTQYVSKARLQIWKVVVNLDLRTGAERLD